MDNLDSKIDKLVVVTTQLAVNQENTTANINKLTNDIGELTKDLKDSLCAQYECDSLKDRVSKVEGKVETIEGVPNAVLKRALMTAVAGTVMYLLYSVGISK